MKLIDVTEHKLIMLLDLNYFYLLIYIYSNQLFFIADIEKELF